MQVLTDPVIFFKLLAAFLVSEYILLPKSWRKDWEKKEHASPYLYLHAFISGVVSYMFLWNWSYYPVILIVAITQIMVHLLELGIKGRLWSFVVGTFIHVVVLLLLWLVITRQNGYIITALYDLFHWPQLWLIVSGYIWVLMPTGKVIAFATVKWQEINDNGLTGAGTLIGYVERVIIVTFVLLDQYHAIGFLITAKSVFRYSDIKKEQNRKKAEYILTGTLLSYAFAIITAVIIKMLL
ncbi:MAG: DUF3307 domain-containing protein [Cyclobacteriaceae bacterium]|nr:DUF3307 domain-containing protein [Cyclobacteriaceae bacterium]